MLKALQTAGLIVLAIPFSIPLALAATGWLIGTIQGANAVYERFNPGQCGPNPISRTGGPFLLTLVLMLLSAGGMPLALFLAYRAGARSRKH